MMKMAKTMAVKYVFMFRVSKHSANKFILAWIVGVHNVIVICGHYIFHIENVCFQAGKTLVINKSW